MGAPESSSPIGGKYEILQKLQEGGMGAVYKVRHRLLEEIRVVKVIRPQLEASEEVKGRFLREARSAVRLRHPNIAELYDFTVDESGVGFMVMEFIDGVDLRRLTRKRGRLGIALSLEVTTQALRALGYLHRSGFVHRDISPDNLMVTKDVDGRPLVKLIDLGIAKPLGGDESLTLTGSFLGKFRYAAPEQFGGAGLEIDGRTDLYSLGVVLYEMVTGKHPFPGETQQEVVGGHLFHPPIDFDETDPDGRVPERLRKLVLRALEKNADDRFASAEEFSEAVTEIRQAIDEEIDESEIPSQAERATDLPEEGSSPGSTQERLDQQFGIGESTPIVTTLETEILPPDETLRLPTEEPEETQIAPPPRSRALLWVGVGVAVAVLAVTGYLLVGRGGEEASDRPLSSPSQVQATASDPVALEPTQDRRIVDLLAEARVLFRRGENRETLEVLDRVLGLAPENPDAQRLLSELLSSARRGAERARSLAEESEARRRAAPTVAAAEEALDLAERESQAGNLIAATSGLWRSAELFEEGIRQAEAAAAAELRRSAEAATVEARRAAAAEQRAAELEERAREAERQRAAEPAATPRPNLEHQAGRQPVAAPAPEPEPAPQPEPVRQQTRTPSPSPPPTPVDERPAVLQTLRAYESAYEALDVEALRGVWPSLTGARLAAIRGSFEGAREIEVAIEDCRIRTEGTAGSATCRVRQDYRPRHGPRQTDDRQVTFQLRKAEGRWVIESL